MENHYFFLLQNFVDDAFVTNSEIDQFSNHAKKRIYQRSIY